jgi:hypothetical protein
MIADSVSASVRACSDASNDPHIQYVGPHWILGLGFFSLGREGRAYDAGLVAAELDDVLNG